MMTNYIDTISYVLPVHNQQLYIKKCLDSLIKQEVKGEIIVINDGSYDFTNVILDKYKNKIDKLITNKTRRGSAYSRNIGNEIASGSIIAVCDCDYYFPTRSKSILEFFNQFPEKDVYYSALYLREYNELQASKRMSALEWDYNSKCPISHPTVAYRSKVTKKHKYDESCIDTDLYEFFLLDLKRAGHEFGGDDTVRMTKLEGDKTRDRSKAKIIKEQKYKEYKINLGVSDEEI
tara:strand:+ start:112 stop:813 length:702 start_codon:yes stop_codon:yes gene_type:complete